MKFEGVSWNISSFRKQIANGLTQEQFVQRGINNGIYRAYGQNQSLMLLEAWRLILSLSS
jgi:hypothetical protein